MPNWGSVMSVVPPLRNNSHVSHCADIDTPANRPATTATATRITTARRLISDW